MMIGAKKDAVVSKSFSVFFSLQATVALNKSRGGSTTDQKKSS